MLDPGFFDKLAMKNLYLLFLPKMALTQCLYPLRIQELNCETIYNCPGNDIKIQHLIQIKRKPV